MRRRRIALGVLALLLLGSCTAAGLSVATGRGPSGSGTVTATADVGPESAPRSDAAPAAQAPPESSSLGAGTGTATSAPPAPSARGTAAAPPRAVVTGDVEQQVLVTLAGSTEGLLPGRRGQLLQVVVGNDAANDDDLLLTLTSVSAVARGPAGSCGPEDLVVTPYSAGPGAPTFTVRRGQSVVVPLEVVFVDRLDRDQTDCAGATFPLTLTTTAEVTA